MATYHVFQKRLTNWFNKLSVQDRTKARLFGYRAQGKTQVYESYLVLLQITQTTTYNRLYNLMGRYRIEQDYQPKLALRRQIIDLTYNLPYLDYDDACKLWDVLYTQEHYEWLIIDDKGQFLQHDGSYSYYSDGAMASLDWDDDLIEPDGDVLLAKLVDNKYWEIV